MDPGAGDVEQAPRSASSERENPAGTSARALPAGLAQADQPVGRRPLQEPEAHGPEAARKGAVGAVPWPALGPCSCLEPRCRRTGAERPVPGLVGRLWCRWGRFCRSPCGPENEHRLGAGRVDAASGFRRLGLGRPRRSAVLRDLRLGPKPGHGTLLGTAPGSSSARGQRASTSRSSATLTSSPRLLPSRP
jgi:hypothetical protein